MYERTYHKTVLKDDTGGKKKRSRINWKKVLRLLAAVVVIVGIVIVTRLPRLQVQHIQVVGINVVDPGDITEFVQQQLQGNRLFLFPKSSIFLVPESRVEKNLKKHFSRLQSAEVSRTNFSTLTVTVSEYQGIYLWCADEATCYFMDQNGMAFSSAPYFSGNAYPKIFEGTLQPIPFQAITAGQVATVALLMDRLPSIGIVPEEFHFMSGHEFDVYFNHNGHQAQLMFNPAADAKEALTSLYTGLRTNPLATKYRDNSEVLQYIDLRFANRVVYKFQ